MTTPAPPHSSTLRSLYRALLREFPPRPLLSPTPTPLRQRLRENFRASSSPTPPPERQQHAVAQTQQLVAYLRAQRTYTALLERYNPGMGMDEEERVRLTARRVGMDLPVEFGGEVE